MVRLSADGPEWKHALARAVAADIGDAAVHLGAVALAAAAAKACSSASRWPWPSSPAMARPWSRIRSALAATASRSRGAASVRTAAALEPARPTAGCCAPRPRVAVTPIF